MLLILYTDKSNPWILIIKDTGFAVENYNYLHACVTDEYSVLLTNKFLSDLSCITNFLCRLCFFC